MLPLLGRDDTPTRAAWEAAAAAVLRRTGLMGADDADAEVAARLDRTTLDGVVVPALGTAEDVRELPPSGEPGAAPYTRGNGPRAENGWDIRAHLAEPDRERAAADALTDLKNGVTSLWVVVGETGTAVGDLDAMLADVYVDFAPVVVEADPTADPVEVARALATVIADREAPADPRTNPGLDPVGRLARWGRGPGGEPGDIGGVVAAAAELAMARGIRGVVVDATVVHEAGGTDAQELGYALATGVTYLRALERAGVAADVAAGLIEFRFVATDEQFPTIAKLRAARALWHRVTELAGFPVGDRRQHQHAVTSRPMTTRYDPWVNLLRTTVAAFAAGAGGADAVTVLPFDHSLGRPAGLARRLARNTSSLLIHEAHVARVADPAGGAYAVELLTDRMARAGWAEFQRLEAAGGVVTALGSGELAAGVAGAWEQRRAEIATRARPITGVSEFPLAAEALLERAPRPRPSVTAGPGALRAVSYAGDFESLRDDAVDTPVGLVTVGPIARNTTRASFVRNLLAAGGIPVASGVASSVVVLAGADSDYERLGPDVIGKLRSEGARWIVLTGSGPTVVADLVDDTVAAGDDMIAFLRRTRARLTEPTR